MTTTNTDITEELKEELRVYQALKPYIGHCLSLNHDINNPLAGILGYAEFMMVDAESLSEDQIHNLQQIIICAGRIQKLVEALCDEKISLDEKIDLRTVTDAYKAVAKSLD